MLNQVLLNAIHAGILYGLIAASFGLIQTATRVFHFAHAVVFTAAAYLAFTFINLLHLPVPVGVGVAIAGATILGVATEAVVYRPMRRRNRQPIVLLICSLGILVVLQNLIPLLYGDETKSFAANASNKVIDLGTARLTEIQALAIGVSIFLGLCLWIWLQLSKTGRGIRAVANDPNLSEIVGVNSEAVFCVAFGVGSALVAVAGIFAGFDTDLTPSMGFRALLMGIVACFLGGAGSVPGAFLGGLIIGFLQQFTASALPIHWQDTVVLGILILVLIARPQGILGKASSQLTA